MAEVRLRLRSGRWGDSEAEIEEIVEQYKRATPSFPKCVATNETPAEMLERMSASPRSRCALYTSDAAPALRRLTEVFVVYG